MNLQAMDLAEVRNLVKWLDEQQRKSRQELAVLQQQFDTQKREMDEMSTRTQELEERIPNMQSQITRLNQIDREMDNLKAEIVHLVEKSDDKRIQSEKEMERLRLVEHQAHTRAISDLQSAITSVPRLQEEMENRKAEDQRLSSAVGILQNQIPAFEARLDERVRDVAYLEEAQRQDARRIAELQQELLEFNKRADAQESRQLTISDTQQRTEARVERLATTESERKQQSNEFMEKGRLADQKRTHQLGRWGTKLEEFEELMSGYARQWRLFEEQHRASKEATGDLVEFKKRLEQRQTELAELQRVENERMKQQWTEFLGKDDQRQKQQLMERDQWIQEQKRQREISQERLRAIQEQLDKTSQDVKNLFTLQEKYADNFRHLSRIWMEAYETVVAPPITRKVPG